jgi:hypothetical protein
MSLSLRITILLSIGLSGCVSAPLGGAKEKSVHGTIASGKRTRIGTQAFVKGDCTFEAYPYTHVEVASSHGTIEIVHEEVRVKFEADSSASVCSNRPVQGSAVYYTPNPGYTGPDHFSLRGTGMRTGKVYDLTYDINVVK